MDTNYTPSDQLVGFLNMLEETAELPKTILYFLNPADDEEILGKIVRDISYNNAVRYFGFH